MQQLILNLQSKGTYKQPQLTARQSVRQELRAELLRLRRMGLRCLQDLEQQQSKYRTILRLMRMKAERMSRVYDPLHETDMCRLIEVNEKIIDFEISLAWVEEQLCFRQRLEFLEDQLCQSLDIKKS